MKKLTKIFAWALVICVLLALVTSCKGQDETNDKETDKPTDTVGTDNVSAQGSQESGNSETDTPTKHGITIDETVLVDENGLKITALSLDPEDALTTNICIENNSGKELTIDVAELLQYSYVNNYTVRAMFDGSQNCKLKVKNEEKSYHTISFLVWDYMKDIVTKDGIVADFEPAFHIYDDEIPNEYWEPERVKVKTSAADTYDYTFDDSGTILYDDKDIKVVLKGVCDFGEVSVFVTVENNSDTDICVYEGGIDAVLINDYAAYEDYQTVWPWVDSGKNSIGLFRYKRCDYSQEGKEPFVYDGNIEGIKTITTKFWIDDKGYPAANRIGETGLITFNLEWNDGKPTVTVVPADAE